MSPTADTLAALGDTVRFVAEARDASGHAVAGAEVTWSSSDAAVATVDESGLATAVGNGTASVTASSGGQSASALLTVAQMVAEIGVSPTADTLAALGDTVRFVAEARDASGHAVAGAEVTWSSSDAAVATVDESGLATAVGNGTASVTASSGGQSASALLTVAQMVAEIGVSPTADTLAALGDTVRFVAEARDASGHAVAGAEVTWSSSDAAVATVDESGLATAVGNGTASVTASTGGQSASATVTVEQRVAGVSVSPAADTLLALGDTVRFVAEVKDANGHAVAGAEFMWSSADAAVVAVDDSGLVTAVGNGTASVTVSSGELSGSAIVTVEQRVAQVSVSPPADTLFALGDTARLSAEPMDANGHSVAGAGVLWASADEAVAAVDTTGLVTAIGDGVASVTASSGGVAGSAALTVAQLAVEMRLSPEADTLAAPGDTLRLVAEADDANGHLLGSPRFTWTSADESLATVDGSGLVTGVAAGTVEVTVVEGTAGLTRSAVLLVVEPRSELLDLYEALGGTGWTNAGNWGTDAPVDTWYGITTDSEGRITEIDLSNNGLTGGIPPGIGLIQTLEVLDLSGNGLTGETAAAYDPGERDPAVLDLGGPIMRGLAPGRPEDPLLDALPDLAGEPELALDGRVAYSSQQSTDIEVCALPTGPLPVGQGLTSPIPLELGTLRNLRVLDLSYNSLTGPIPAELGNMESLEFLDLGWNTLEGPIPPELGQLGNLEVLNVCGNTRRDGTMIVGGLTGSIPAELGNLMSLKGLALNINELTGSIPSELGNLQDLELLWLFGNALTGPIPSELGDLHGLKDLHLGWNQLTGSIPSELADLQSLEELWLFSNMLTGPIPSQLGNLQNLEALGLYVNMLTGPIPSELGDLHSLRHLGLYANMLTGPIPSELADLQKLERLWLAGNQLTGTIPRELGNMSNLASLALGLARYGGNELTGSIPPELGNLEKLVYLNLRQNDLTGPIPTELGRLDNLRYLGLCQNRLTGPIPSEIGQFRDLWGLCLHDNGLTGPIPSSLGNLRNLLSLWVHFTDLEGPIPHELVNVPLRTFSWHDTRLCAPPDEAFQTWLQSIGNHNGGENCPVEGSLSLAPGVVGRGPGLAVRHGSAVVGRRR